MQQDFPLFVFDGHLLFEYDGLTVLIDSGSPVTISAQDRINFMGTTFGCREFFIHNNIQDIGTWMGHEVDVMMGLDVLSHFSILVDIQQAKITFSDEPLSQDGVKLPMEQCHGFFAINFSVNKKPVKMIFDTGAKISYINPELTQNMEPICELDDFSPLINARFRTPIYQFNADACGKQFNAAFGNLPVQLDGILEQLGVDGFIGHELFKAFKASIDFENCEMTLSPH